MSDDPRAAALAAAHLTTALVACRSAWRERFRRSPTTNELVSAFEVCLCARPDDRVVDVGPVLALQGTPAPRPPTSLAVADFGAEWALLPSHSLPVARLFAFAQRRRGVKDRWEIQASFEPDGAHLHVELTHGAHPFGEAVALVVALAVPRFVRQHAPATIRVTLYAAEGLADPIALPWPPP